jgi:hypothetical protein
MVDLFFGGAVGHVDDHGDDPFYFAAKNESRDFYRGFGGIFELSLFLCRLAPILHLRREWKPIAAKKAEVAKSCHRDANTGNPDVFRKLVVPRLLYGTGHGGECVVGIAPDQTNRADHQYQDDGEHDRVFSDVLPLFVFANIAEKLNHRSSGPTPDKFPGKLA